jgi:uncharacterized membrane protein
MFGHGCASVRYRTIAIICASSVLLTACAAQGIPNEQLTPAQRQLKETNQRFTETVATGAIVGALLGAALGATLGGRNRAAMAALGTGAGAALGGAAGYAVARNNLAHAQTEQNLQKAIAEANQDAVAYQRSAVLSAQIASDAHAKAAELDAQYQQKQITATQYRQSLAGYRESATIMQKQLGQMEKETALLQADGSAVGGGNGQTMVTSAQQIEQARQDEERSYRELEQILASGPAG